MAQEGSIGRALAIAFVAHDGQLDKGGEPYILHSIRVMYRLGGLASDEERAAALLHDVVEDTAVGLDRLRAEGIPESVVTAVDAITKRKGEDKAAYYARVKADPVALRVKMADIADNSDPVRMSRLDEPMRLRLGEKYRLALASLA